MAAHTLKGGSGYLGASRLAELCLRVEELAESGDLSTAGSGIDEIVRELAVLSEVLEEELEA